MKPVIRKSGRHWIIDCGPGKASPCLNTKEDAERLVLLMPWMKKAVCFVLNGREVEGKVVNTALLHEQEGETETVIDMLGVRVDGSTYWVRMSNIKEAAK